MIAESPLGVGQSEDIFLRRTVCIKDLPILISEEKLLISMSDYGVIERICTDFSTAGKFALVEFAEECSAKDFLNSHSVNIDGRLFPVSAALRTSVVYNPHNVVFGKPIAIGRHVMATNPTLLTNSIITRRQRILRDVENEISKILNRISQDLPGLVQ